MIVPLNSSSGESVEDEKKLREYYLVRVPKSITVKELNGAQIDLGELGPSQSVIVSKSDPDKSYGYDVIQQKATTFSNLTHLNTDDQIQLDSNYCLRGCINFYVHRSLPENELSPLVPTCPNDSIEEIVNRARGHSVKRKTPAVKSEMSSPLKRKKHKSR